MSDDKKKVTKKKETTVTKTTEDFGKILEKATPIINPVKWQLIKATVIKTWNKNILVDLNGQFMWVVAWKEMTSSTKTIWNIKVWDEIEAMVIGEDKESGLIIMSFRKASQIALLEKLSEDKENTEIFTVVPDEANKWWLLVDLDGIKWFIPVSQLTPMNYPRVEWADPERILDHLKWLIGKEFKVRVLNADPAGKKIIFSEKSAISEQRQARLDKLKVWNKVEWVVSGILSYGLFVTFEWLEWLVHVSEIDWGHVSDPSRFAKVWDKVSVEVIWIDGEKISLSMKRLKPNPWQLLSDKYKVWDIVEAVVIRVSRFWVFLWLDGGINWLIHLSEISYNVVENIEDYVRVWDKVKAKIITFDPKAKRIGLSLKALQEAPKTVKKPAPKKAVAKKDTTKKTEEKTEKVKKDVKKTTKKDAAKKTEKKVEKKKTEKKESK